MRVWLIKIGEPLPVVDGPSIRKMRMSLLADQLVAAGHEVVWWASTFSHAKKAHRFPDDKVVDVSDSFQIRMMKALGYSRSRSPARIIDHCLLARRFARLARRQERPDVIVSAMPTPGLSRAAGEYGRQFGVPVVVDIRDLWPDCYVEPARGLKRALTWLAFRPMARTLRKACRLATAITGISRPAVDWAVGYAGREPTADDRVVPHGYTRRRPTDEQIEQARAFWADRGIPDEPGRFIACFFGYFGADYDIESVIEAARILQAGGLSMTFALCGEGDRLASCRELAREVPGVVLPGWVGFPEIWTMMQMASVGLAPYITRWSFRRILTNKPIEYLSGGLPLVSCLEGVVADLIAEHDCGITYRLGDPAGLADALRRLHEDRKRLARMSHNARALYERQFVGEKVYGEMVGLLERLAASAARADRSGR